MPDRLRNIIVGLTILIALGVCMYGIFLLGKFPGVGIRQYVISLVSADAAGMTNGSKVELNGVVVGQVREAYLAKDAAGKMIAKIDILLPNDVDVPKATRAELVRPTAGVGQPYVELKILDLASPALSKDGSATLDAIVADSGLIPKEVFEDVTTLARSLTTVSHDLHALLAYTPPEAIEKGDPNDPNRPMANASTVVIRLDRTVKSLQDLLTDPKLHGQVRDAVQNIVDASAQLKSTMEKLQGTLGNADKMFASAGNTLDHANKSIDAIGGAATQASVTLQAAQSDINHVAQQLVETMAGLDKTIKEIAEGNGTTGKLISDPRLYEGLVDLSKSLKSTVNDLDFLIDKWRDEGVDLRLK